MESKRPLWLVVKLLVLAGLLAVVAWWVDWSSLTRVASQVPVWAMLAVLAGGVGSRLVCTTRWNVLCAGLMPTPGIPRLYRLGLLAEFVNLWVPSSLGGEAVRIWGLKDLRDAPTATLSVAIDRVLGLVGLVLALLPVPFLVQLPFPGWVLPAVVVVSALGIGAGLALRDRIAGLTPWASALAGLSAPRIAAALALSTLAPWCIVAGYVAFFHAVHPLTLGEVAAFLLITRFGRAVPVSVLGVNSVEGSMLLLGAAFGIPSEVVALSVAMNFTDKLVNSLLGGVVELAANGREGLSTVMASREP